MAPTETTKAVQARFIALTTSGHRPSKLWGTDFGSLFDDYLYDNYSIGNGHMLTALYEADYATEAFFSAYNIPTEDPPEED